VGGGFVDGRGLSVVAGKVALVAGGADPAAAATAAAAGGAKAVVLYGPALPAGPLDLQTGVDVPVVAVPAGPALTLVAARRLGLGIGISLAPAAGGAEVDGGHPAVFS